METSPLARPIRLLRSQHIPASAQLSDSQVKVSQAGVVSLQFYKVNLLTAPLKGASPLCNRSGGGRSVCQEGFRIHLKPRHLQGAEFCRRCTEGEDLGELAAFTKIFLQMGRTRRAIV